MGSIDLDQVLLLEKIGNSRVSDVKLLLQRFIISHHSSSVSHFGSATNPVLEEWNYLVVEKYFVRHVRVYYFGLTNRSILGVSEIPRIYLIGVFTVSTPLLSQSQIRVLYLLDSEVGTGWVVGNTANVHEDQISSNNISIIKGEKKLQFYTFFPPSFPFP